MKTRVTRAASVLLAICLFVTGCVPALADDLVLPASLKTIGESAFEDDTSLDEVVLPEGIETIGSRAFADSSLTHINLPPSLNSIAGSAFDNTPHAAFHAQPGTYAYQWLEDHKRLLYFTDANAGEITVDMAVFEENSEIGLYSDPFVCYYAIADLDTWLQRLSGEPVWTVTQTSGPATDFWIDGASPYERGLGVAMPDSPLTAEYEIRCVWDGQQVVSHTTVNYVYPNVVPSAVDAPDLIRLIPNVENIVPFSFEPSFFSFGEFRVGLEDYAGEEEHWFEGNYLHIIPASEGTYTANVYLYAGNMYIGKPVVFRVGGAGSALDPAVEASGLDWYTLTWNPVEGVSSYTVSAYTDEACTQLFHTLETADAYTYVNTDVGTRYWFTVEYEADGQTVRSGPVTADPVTPLPAPENLAAAVLEDGTVQLTWDPVGDVWGYRIYTSSIPEWTLDTEWFSFEGGPGYDGLQVDVGETLYVWVCADNYDGPNERAMVTVYREYALTDEELRTLAEDESFDLHLSDSVLANLTAAGADPTQVQALADAIAAYNDALDALIDFIDEHYAGIAVSLVDGSLVYTSSRTSFTVSAAALDLIASGHEAGEWVYESGNSARLEVFVDGQTYYLEQSAAGLGVTSPGRPVSREASNDPIQPILTEYDELNQSYDGQRQYQDAYQDALDNLDIQVTAMQEYGHVDGMSDLRDGIEMTKNVNELLGLPELHDGMSRAHQMLLRLNEIAAHHHPTAMESVSSYSMDIVSIMTSKLNAARWALASEILNNMYRMYECIDGVLKNLAGKLQDQNPRNETLSKLTSFFASKGLTCNWIKKQYEKAHSLYEDVLNLDKELHYDISGVVTSSLNQKLVGVKVALGSVPDEISTTTDADGCYFIEVPFASSELYYFKEGYYPEMEYVTAAPVPYESTQQNVVLELGAWGTVTGTVRDEFGDPVPGALIHAGEYISAKGRWEYSATSQSDGSYSLLLPAVNHPFEVTTTKDGYRNAFLTASVPVYDSCSWDPVLYWQYGVKGTVKNGEDPVPNAYISFYRGNSSRPEYGCHADENGNFHYKLPPGVYTMEVSANNYISSDLQHEKYRCEGFVIHEDAVKVIDPTMVCITGKYKCNFTVSVVSGNDVSVHYIEARISWGDSSVHSITNSAHPIPGCICVSDVKDVMLHIVLTYEVDGVTYTKERDKLVDLTSLPEQWTYMPLTLGWWDEP